MSDIDVEAVDDVDEDQSDGPPPDSTEAESTRVDSTETDASVDVEAVAEPDAPEYVLYGGKGGVGKTTCAAATALASAADGVATLVVSTDPAHSLADTLGTDVPAHPARIREDIPLYAAAIDPDAAMEEGLFGGRGDVDGEGAGAAGGDPLGGIGGLGGMGGLGGTGGAMENGPLDGGPMGALLDGSMPGADEAAAMQQLLEHLDDPRFDRVVVDTAPTGHTLRLLQLPELLDSMVGRLLSLRQQVSGMMEGVKGTFGLGEGGPEGPDLDELKERIERLRAVLCDPDRTDFRVVTVPEAMSVVESERLVDRLDEFGIPVSTLVVNRVMEDPAEVAGAPLDEEWVVTPNLADCEFCGRRWEVQQEALSRATALFRGRDVKRVPLLADEVRGEDALRVVAACLA